MPKYTPAAQAFLAKRPTLIVEYAGDRLYESPTYGDEVPLIAILRDGRKLRTTFYDKPSLSEWLDFRANSPAA